MSSPEDAQKQQAQDQKAQLLQVQYNKYQEQVSGMQSQLGDLTSQLQEHIIVEKSLTSIPPNKREGRKCFKMIGGVLVNKLVDEVIKILNDDMKVLEKTKTTLEQTLVDTRKEMEKWMKNNNVKVIKGQQ
ncbi:Prefoldin [Hyphopichia burtonii NRRL Y-1933]|uniref:Prefoldin n=1 Tax=Hyphopichia burtonii NRRL Y-1933 TaxID=984485 RepID=A0A1E4RPM4_9ASCO|nr:Prefoldin [Hyphopichia burtonii NRRL Y-1933]ODV69223.1 Prefoldin [Hyphopichia burtonii NRRL Y-1933]